MAISSVVLYLAARKSALLKTSLEFNNLSMFLIPVVIYSLLAYGRGTDMTVTPYQMGIIVILAIFFSWLGNVASLKSIEAHPSGDITV